MQGVKFYQEFHNSRKTKPTGNCVAILAANGFSVDIATKTYDRLYDAVAAPWDGNGNVIPCSARVSAGYLRSKCKRVTEAKAREIHPNLFTMLVD